MISEKEIHQLLCWPMKKESRVLSVYLQCEHSWNCLAKMQVNYKRLAHELRGKTGLLPEALQKNMDRVWRFLTEYAPKGGESLIIFCNVNENKFWTGRLEVPVRDRLAWLEKPFLLPLLEVWDEYERYGVILADKNRARIFTYCLGEIEEEKDVLAWNNTRHFRSSGKDNLRSAFKLERTSAMHVSWHLKHVAETALKMARMRKFDRLILGGSKRAVDELLHEMDTMLLLKVAGRLTVPVSVPDGTLRDALTKLMASIEREKENEEVSRLLNPEVRFDHHVFGLQESLLSLNRGRIRQLIYSENFKKSDLLEDMVRDVIAKGGHIEQVHGAAACRLDLVGGIAAISNKN